MAPAVLLATPVPAAAAPPAALSPGQREAMQRVAVALGRRDARALAATAGPDGVGVAPFGGGLPDGGYQAQDATALARAMLGAGELQILGWRAAGGGVIVLATGWQSGVLPLAAGVTQEMSSLAAIGLVSGEGGWYWRWVMPDPVGALAQQARSVVWQPWPV